MKRELIVIAVFFIVSSAQAAPRLQAMAAPDAQSQPITQTRQPAVQTPQGNVRLAPQRGQASCTPGTPGCVAPPAPASNIRMPAAAASGCDSALAGCSPVDGEAGNIRRPQQARTPTSSPMPAQATAMGDEGNIRLRERSAPLSAEAPTVSAETDAGVDPALASAAVGGDRAAMQALAMIYYAGDGVRQDYRLARRWAEAAASAGDPTSALLLGWLNMQGLGGPRDLEAARIQLTQARNGGLVRANYLLGLIEDGRNTPGSDKRALQYYLAAAQAGDALAQNAVGVHYQLAGDRDTARMWYSRAEKSGSRAAAVNLRNLEPAAAEKGKAAASTDSIASLRAKAQAGDAKAQYDLARRLHQGRGVPTDYTGALRWYRMSAQQQYAPAKRMLGLILSRPPPPDDPNGINVVWMQQLAFQDSPVDERDAAASNTSQGANLAAQPRLDADPLQGMMPKRR